MDVSKWYLVNGVNGSGNYAQIKEEKSDLIVAEFPALGRHAANERSVNLQVVVDEHNKVVKMVEKLSETKESNEPTHVVLDLFYRPDEGQECYEGTEQECHNFVKEQGGSTFMYKVVPITKNKK